MRTGQLRSPSRLLQERREPHLLHSWAPIHRAGPPGKGCSRRTPETTRDGLGASVATESSKDWGALGRTRGLGLGPPCPAPHLLPSDLFKRENRKAKKRRVGDCGVLFCRDKVPRTMLSVGVSPALRGPGSPGGGAPAAWRRAGWSSAGPGADPGWTEAHRGTPATPQPDTHPLCQALPGHCPHLASSDCADSLLLDGYFL